MAEHAAILQVRNLVVDFPGGSSPKRVLDNISLSLVPGEILGIVGASGCGKSTLARALLRLENPGRIVSGSIQLDGHELTDKNQKTCQGIRGKKISLVMQNPKSAMDPVFTVENQFRDVFSVKPETTQPYDRSRTGDTRKIHDLLRDVGIASAKARSRQYPHQWSRGMLQRAQLQMVFSTRPQVVILDEVTSALDPTITVQILDLITLLRDRHHTAMIFITHDLGVAMTICDRVAVMHDGCIIESGPSRRIFETPSHAYTRQLVAGVSGNVRTRPDTPEQDTDNLIQVRDLCVQFPMPSKAFFSRGRFDAVKKVSLSIGMEEISCLIGESGSGKTTLMNAILGLLPYDQGEIRFQGETIRKSNDPVHQKLVSRARMVFQDPVGSLSPYRTLAQSIEEPLTAQKVPKLRRKEIVRQVAAEVGLSHALLEKKPHEVSVGQNQRACIARALSTAPDLLFLDEPLSALDAVSRKEIAKLIADLKHRHHLTCFLITHDMGLVRDVGTFVAVMYLGRIVEKAPVNVFFSYPAHPYSRALLSNTLAPGLRQNERILLEGEIPSPHHPPTGCVFHPRCPERLKICRIKPPVRTMPTSGHEVLCHLYGTAGDHGEAS